MAQVLKAELKDAIIKAAKQEFLEKGYKAASMRQIAKRSNMTVGNLYRYFKSKEEINLTIVGPTFKKIDLAIKSLSRANIDKIASVYEAKADIDQLERVFSEFVDQIINIYRIDETEFNILILHSKLDEELSNSFSFAFDKLLSQHFVLPGLSSERILFSNAYGKAMFEGMKNIFGNNENDYKQVKRMLNIYFKSFIYLANDSFGVAIKKV